MIVVNYVKNIGFDDVIMSLGGLWFERLQLLITKFRVTVDLSNLSWIKPSEAQMIATIYLPGLGKVFFSITTLESFIITASMWLCILII